MGYNVANWEMIRTREEKLSLDGAEDQHTIMNNMVDARACYKPSGKVSVDPHEAPSSEDYFRQFSNNPASPSLRFLSREICRD